MGKPRFSKVARGSDEIDPSDVSCLACGRIFRSINPKRIRICPRCKSGKKRRKSQEIVASKEIRVTPLKGANPDMSRKQRSRY